MPITPWLGPNLVDAPLVQVLKDQVKKLDIMLHKFVNRERREMK